ncbi:MAG TPA: pirin family protein [Thermoanaerobaculia bacterium]|nr:pirin family protein [Thermoanaerobaculia bacterium]
MPAVRTAAKIVRSAEGVEGEGFLVHRPFPSRELIQVDPFLLLDEMGPAHLEPHEARGAPDHPHRGFETVTYILEGSMEHLDSTGRGGRIGAGDVQWMTAGRGVIHSEMPGQEIVTGGGNLHGVQLWVNLPKAEKWIDPKYQAIVSSDIPEWRSDDGAVLIRILAGSLFDEEANVATRTPIVYLHLKLSEGASIDVPVDDAFNAIVYALSGTLTTGEPGTEFGERTMALLRRDAPQIRLAAPGGPAEARLIAGKPIGEPIARFGPFVMNTREELIQAIQDYQSGKFV